MSDWYKETFCKLHIDFHTPESVTHICNGFSSEKIAEKIIDAGFQAVQIHTKGHFGNSYYYTNVGHRHPALTFDLFGKLVEALTKNGIKVLAYYSLRLDAYQARIHPDWTVRSSRIREEPQDAAEGYHICFQSPYLEEVVVPQVKEITKGYPISGFFFDFPRSNGYCGCVYCQRAFHDAAGEQLPENNEQERVWPKYVEWKREEQERVEILLSNAIHDIRPDVLFTCNYSYTLRNPKRIPEYYGFITMDVEEMNSYGLNVSINAKYLTSREKHFDIMTSRLTGWWKSWGLKPLNSILYQNAVILAHGGRTFLGDRADIDWELNDTVYDYFKSVNVFVNGIKDICIDSAPVAYIGVLHSRESYDDCPDPSNDHMDMLDSVKGAHKILVHKHFHHIILDEYGLDNYLDKLQMLIIPEQGKIDISVSEKIRDFVNRGGVIIASYNSVCNSTLEDIFGIKIRSEFKRGFLMPDEDSIDRNIPRVEIPMNGRFKDVQNISAKVIMKCFKPSCSLETGFGFGSLSREKEGIGVTVNKYGKGTALYIAPEIFKSYWKINVPPVKHLIAKLIDRYVPVKLLEIDAPENVEIVLMEKNGNKILHLINFTQEKSEKNDFGMVDDIMPVYSIKVRLYCPGKIESIVVYPEKKKIDWERDNDKFVCFTIPHLELYQGICIRQQPRGGIHH